MTPEGLHVHRERGVQAFRVVLGQLLNKTNGHTVNGNAMHSEIINCQIYVDDAESLDFELDGRNQNTVYKYTEALWDLGPSDNTDILKAVNPVVMRFVQDQPEATHGYAVWAYGPHIHSEIVRVVKELKKDPFSRRAVISLPRTMRILGTPPCLIYLQFIIRDGCLVCIAAMRSNDVWLGLQLDMFQFNLVQRIVAAGVGVPLGAYIHQANSMHLYERDVEAAIKCFETRGVGDKVTVVFPFGPDAVTQVRDCRLYNALRKAVDGVVTFPTDVEATFSYYLTQIAKHQALKKAYSG